MNTSHLLLWFEGPLQSWGVRAKFSRRTTLEFPSRSAVLGLICAALGAGGEQKELLALFAPLEQTVIAYSWGEKNGKAINALQLQDFHMVGSGYDDKDPWQKLHIPKTNEQKPAVGGGTKLTYRYYLQDSAFAVALAIPDGLCEKVADALITPYWDITLGRKTCVPTEFVYQGMHESMDDALKRAEDLAAEKKYVELFRVMDGSHKGEQLVLPDVPLQFGPEKRYAERLVTLMTS
jgi:CRISPR system Cascade subunit CasD